MPDSTLTRSADQTSLFAKLFEDSFEPQFVWTMEPGHRIVLWNPAAARLYGITPDAARGQDPRLLLATEPEVPWATVDAALASAGEWRGDLRQRTAAGTDRIIQTAMRVLKQPDAKPLVLETGRDITGQLEAESRLRVALEAARTGIWEWSVADQTQYWSAELLAVFGLTRETQPTTPSAFFALIHPDDRAGAEADMRGSFAAGRPVNCRFRIVRPDGATRWIHSFGVCQNFNGKLHRVVGVSRDITEEVDAARVLRESVERARATAAELTSVMNTVPAAVWISRDPGCLEIIGNPAGHAMLRAPVGVNLSKSAPATPQAQNFRVFHDGRELAAHELPMQTAARENREVRGFEEELRFEDGHSIHVIGSAAPLLDDAGRPRGAVASFVDVTPIKRAHEQLLEAARRKDEFLAILSHELRNPLAPILSAAQLMKLRGDVASPNEREVILRQTHHLIRLVDDLLDVSRVTSGKIVLHKEPVDLAVVVANAVEATAPLFELRQHRLTVSAPGDALTVNGDAVRLTQVASNLLSNAARYTPPGGSIEIAAWREGGEAMLRVADNGDGIDAAFLPRIFEMFVQGERGRDRAEGGLGLGLALVQSLVALHGGSVAAESGGKGRGSVFTVRLPANDLARTARVEASATAAPSPTRQARRLLLVDDNVDAAELLSALLSESGYDVRVAHHPSQAQEVADQFAPQVALLDIGLPVMDGHALARSLRERLGAQTPVLIALSGYGQPEDVRKSVETGFAHHLVKPVDVDRLLATLEALLPAG
ncbi:MAG: PAS domain S-box protein [Archangiaceae bacterium]|nr:PAS domain S-box protein [Archangiaceae bacterium]